MYRCVSNIGCNVKDEELKEFFTPNGEVTPAKLFTDKITNRSRGFGFVEKTDDAAAKKTIAETDRATVNERSVKVIGESQRTAFPCFQPFPQK